jgi:hypothetical protein
LQNARVSLDEDGRRRIFDACSTLLDAVERDLKTLSGMEALLAAGLAVAAAGAPRDDTDVPSDEHVQMRASDDWSDRVSLNLEDVSALVEARSGKKLRRLGLDLAAGDAWSYRHDGDTPGQWRDWYFSAAWESWGDWLLEDCAALHTAIFKPTAEWPGR